MKLLFKRPEGTSAEELAEEIDALLALAMNEGRVVCGIQLTSDELTLLRRASKLGTRVNFYTYKGYDIWSP